MPIHDFSFASHAPQFEEHIKASIPSYEQLMEKCVGLSRRFVQNGTSVIDLGCTTGKLLAAIRKQNEASRPNASYLGIDIEAKFKPFWRQRRASNIRFVRDDIVNCRFYAISYASSLFTLQFIPSANKLPLLRRIHEGLVEGGGFFIAEKVLASTSRLQDALTYPYYDFKLRQFSEREVLDKERSLRGQMTLWTEDELRKALRMVGFKELEAVWGDFPFLAILAIK